MLERLYTLSFINVGKCMLVDFNFLFKLVKNCSHLAILSFFLRRSILVTMYEIKNCFSVLLRQGRFILGEQKYRFSVLVHLAFINLRKWMLVDYTLFYEIRNCFSFTFI